MGWSYGINLEGREVGYSVEATCDYAGCGEKIDRGLAYVCGGMHDGDEYGCGRYFCGTHLAYWFRRDPDANWRSSSDPDDHEEMSPQLCDECGPRWQTHE